MNDPLVWAEVDLNAIASNVRELRRVTNMNARLMVAVKANAYGHGAVTVSRHALANGADALGVARLAEGVSLREAGISAPILVFGYTDADSAEELMRWDLTQTVYDLGNAMALSEKGHQAGTKIKVHLKLDTGMGRLGMLLNRGLGSPEGIPADEDTVKDITAMERLPGLEMEGIMTHFASSDSADKTYAERQFQIFMDFIQRLRRAGVEFAVRHAANSGAIIDLPQTHLDMVRAGISLYGLNPSDEVDLNAIHLIPAMSLKAKIVHLKTVPAGYHISYGMTHTTKRQTCIATVPIGYADGYSRLLSNQGQMLVHGRRAPIVGRVCMDLTMLDVGRIDGVALEDEVVAFGRQADAELSADELAATLDTINYEIVSSITARVPRIYI